MKAKLFFLRLALVIGSPLLVLTLLEFALRLATGGALYFTEKNPHYLHESDVVRLTPGISTWWYGCHYQINAQAFRMPHEVGPKKGRRVLGLGDSVTLGMGVRDTADVWPNHLEKLLREKPAAAGPVEVINAGVQGWNLLQYDAAKQLVPAQFTRFMRERGPALAPDIVVYCICLNDIPSQVTETFFADNAGNRNRFKLFPESAREWFKRKAIYRLSRDGYRESRFQKLDFSGILTPPPTPDFQKRVSEEVGNLQQAVEALGARLVCVIVPFSYQVLPANQELLKVNDFWHGVLDERRIPWTDLTPQFRPDNVLQYYALGDYIHLNAKGHALIAAEAGKLIEPLLAAPAQ